VACDGVTFPSDDYMGVVPEAPFGATATTFVVAWAPFAACGTKMPRRIQFKSVR